MCTLLCFTDVYLIPNLHYQAKELPTYKDNDFINDGQKIYIDGENKKMFLEKLRKDVEVCADRKCGCLQAQCQQQHQPFGSDSKCNGCNLLFTKVCKPFACAQ